MTSPLLWNEGNKNPKPPEPPPDVVSVNAVLLRTTTVNTVLLRRKRGSS